MGFLLKPVKRIIFAKIIVGKDRRGWKRTNISNNIPTS